MIVINIRCTETEHYFPVNAIGDCDCGAIQVRPVPATYFGSLSRASRVSAVALALRRGMNSDR